ncbi:hypothetical protein DFH08DRAFT_613008, partial [Mycena albidolilacea]
FPDISDDALDELVAQISLQRPFAGSIIVLGHLEAQAIHIPAACVRESLRKVDTIGVIVRPAELSNELRWNVRGANALWHFDGNEKLKLWGFYVHGCVDSH